MPNVCILTDSTVQFTQIDFPGHDRVHVVPFVMQNATSQEESILMRGKYPRLIPPSAQDFINQYARLSKTYDSILVLALSSLLSPAMSNAVLALHQNHNSMDAAVIDSQTTAMGLGMLVQLAAGAASAGASLKEIDQQLRDSIPHTYMLFCIPNLTYLARAGQMEYAPALVAEMLGMLTIFTFEEGRLVPLEKVRTPRLLLEAFQDFIGEFDSPLRIALLHGSGHASLRLSPLRGFVKDTFPATLFSEHSIQPHLAALLGPDCVGLAVMDSLD